MESEKIEDVFRAQGSVGILDLILGMEDDMRKYQRDVLEKKVQPLAEVQHAVV